jgi:hypothetical protein
VRNADIYDRLQSFLEEKYGALKQYLSITGEMSISMEKSDLHELGRFMAIRQQCRRKIDRIDKSIKAIIDQVNKISRLSRKPEEILRRYNRDFAGIIKAVCPIDEKIMVLAESEGEKLKKELLRFRKNRHALTSYGPQPINRSRYLDTKK